VEDRKLVSCAITALPPVNVDFLMRKSPFFSPFHDYTNENRGYIKPDNVVGQTGYKFKTAIGWGLL
jgi:hypothetical protein